MCATKPLLLITGFLGAGKTTLIRELLSVLSENGVLADVILNDIVNADLDAASIEPVHASSIAPLAASCACCESLDGLVALCGAAAGGDGDLLLIELNGTADPLGMFESFTLLRDTLPFSPMVQICVIDARHWGRRGELTQLETRQMEGAGLHLISHMDEAGITATSGVEEVIRSSFPKSIPITTEELFAAVLANALPTALPHELSGIRERDAVHLLSHQVKGCQISLPPKVRRASIERLLSRLPREVLRAKALVKLVEELGSRWLFERCGSEVSPSATLAPGAGNLSSSLLCMGFRLDLEALKALVVEAFGQFREDGRSGKPSVPVSGA